MITLIQQRLRSVYGFGGVHLEAQGGEAKVRVEWRQKSVHVAPTDFFSNSQKQILMLSIFLAGGLRQNWSGFAPVLLDDPVTHFDDLNAYGFVELIRGIISTSPKEWQFLISTCEQRLFGLMQEKFSKLDSVAIFYEFMGLTDKGPIIECRWKSPATDRHFAPRSCLVSARARHLPEHSVARAPGRLQVCATYPGGGTPVCRVDRVARIAWHSSREMDRQRAAHPCLNNRATTGIGIRVVSSATSLTPLCVPAR